MFLSKINDIGISFTNKFLFKVELDKKQTDTKAVLAQKNQLQNLNKAVSTNIKK